LFGGGGVVAKTDKKLVFILPDVHIPEEDEVALECALKAHAFLKPHVTIQLGDLIDAGPFSSHDLKSAQEMRDYDFIGREIDPANLFIDRLQKNTDKTVILGGNHENRVMRYCLKTGIPGLASHAALSPEQLLSKYRSKSSFQYVPYIHSNVPLSFYSVTDDLVAVHGFSTARNAARVHLEKSRTKSVVYGHCHRQESVSDRDPYTGKIIKAFSPGCLCKLQPLYNTTSPTSWVHGFSLIYIGGDSWTDYNITIDRGSCVLPGIKGKYKEIKV
jgi:predicted phosphodiesterase